MLKDPSQPDKTVVFKELSAAEVESLIATDPDANVKKTELVLNGRPIALAAAMYLASLPAGGYITADGYVDLGVEGIFDGPEPEESEMGPDLVFQTSSIKPSSGLADQTLLNYYVNQIQPARFDGALSPSIMLTVDTALDKGTRDGSEFLFWEGYASHLAERVPGLQISGLSTLRTAQHPMLFSVQSSQPAKRYRVDLPELAELGVRHHLFQWAGSRVLKDQYGDHKVYYHGTRDTFEQFDPNKTVDGGLHFGTEAQARMRAGKTGTVIPAYLAAERLALARDDGGNWKQKIAAAKKNGKDGIIYLNRFEGCPIESIMYAQEHRIDMQAISDAEFRRHFPWAEESIIVFDASQIKRLSEIILTQKLDLQDDHVIRSSEMGRLDEIWKPWQKRLHESTPTPALEPRQAARDTFFLALNTLGPASLQTPPESLSGIWHTYPPGPAGQCTAIDYMLMTPLNRFLDPTFCGDVCTPSCDSNDSLYQDNAHCRAAVAPALDRERVGQLAALCAGDDDIAQLVAGEFGRTANGCHVVAFMARAAKPNSVEAIGVRQVLTHIQIKIPDHLDPANQTPDQRTVVALMTSGNIYAWNHLQKHSESPVYRRGAAYAALSYIPDLYEFTRYFGTEEITQELVERHQNLSPSPNGDLPRALSLAREREEAAQTSAKMVDAINPKGPASQVKRGPRP
jgi:hypothetical protein